MNLYEAKSAAVWILAILFSASFYYGLVRLIVWAVG
jgi:hypothetical protein